jgi:hypothetical protein
MRIKEKERRVIVEIRVWVNFVRKYYVEWVEPHLLVSQTKFAVFLCGVMVGQLENEENEFKSEELSVYNCDNI